MVLGVSPPPPEDDPVEEAMRKPWGAPFSKGEIEGEFGGKSKV